MLYRSYNALICLSSNLYIQVSTNPFTLSRNVMGPQFMEKKYHRNPHTRWSRKSEPVTLLGQTYTIKM